MGRARWGLLAALVVVLLAGSVGVVVAVTSSDSEKSASVRSASDTTTVPTEPAVPKTEPTGTTLAAATKYVMTATGFGDARFGMTLAEASTALGTQLVPNKFTPACTDIGILPLTAFGVSNDRLTYFQTQSPDAYTETGLHVGSTTTDVQAAYPSAKRQQETNGPLPLVARDAQGNQFIFYDGATQTSPDKTGPIVFIKVVPASTVSAKLPTTCD